MFLSYAAVAVFTFAILLNIFYLYSPVESAANGFMYELCEECLKSECHVNRKRPCLTIDHPQYKFTCYTCDPENLNPQFYSKLECLHGCTDPSKFCVCDGSCYMCVVKEGADLFNFMDCAVPDKEEQPTCV
ncbi:uncharacterized protein LOC132953012 [Metopolophium dirhodum]|uniref:uncharacterized protein LOC132953012 n=1 Tax=Metopolophium dirhodum TaxID=44670 RepID=UPI00298FE4A0|nr:uncharacterized protein LOC132953012 [Metopolophium dirhodum]